MILAKKFLHGLIGLILFSLGIGLGVLIVPGVEGTRLGWREYSWAFLIIFTTSMGFALLVTSIFGGEDFYCSESHDE